MRWHNAKDLEVENMICSQELMRWKDKRKREKVEKDATIDDDAVDSGEEVENGEGEYSADGNEDVMDEDGYEDVSDGGI